MADLAEEATLLLEQCLVPGPVRIKQDGVEEFGRTGQLVECGTTHLAVRSGAERSVSHQTDGAETDRGSSWLCHASYISDTVARREEKKRPKVGGCGGEPVSQDILTLGYFVAAAKYPRILCCSK